MVTSNDKLEISESFIENDDKVRKSPEFLEVLQPVASKFEPRESIFSENQQYN